MDILREKAKFFLFFLGGCGEEKYKYFKPRPDIQQLTRLLLQFYVTIFGHFKGKSHRNLFLKALGEEKYKYFQPKLGYPPIASKAVGLAMYRKKILVRREQYYDKSYVVRQLANIGSVSISKYPVLEF